MKKIIALIAFLLSVHRLYGLPISNPMDPRLFCQGAVFCNGCEDLRYPGCTCWSVRVGYWGDFVFQRHLKLKVTDSDMNRSEIYTNAGFIALNLWNRLDIFTTLGASNIFISGFSNSFGEPGLNDRNYVKTETDFSWSIGGKLTVLEWNCFGVGLEAQYFRTEPLLNYFYQEDVGRPVYPEKIRFNYHEWQVGGAVSYKIPFNFCSTQCQTDCLSWFVPYVGVKWSRAKIDITTIIIVQPGGDEIGLLGDFENQRDWGWAVGFSLFGGGMWNLSLEGRFVSERALYLSTQFRI